MLRVALAVLLAERGGHGYELAPRLGELGLDVDTGALYRTLRSMDRHGEVRSIWDVSARGPARRVYALTEEGHRLLGQALDAMAEQSLTITRLLGRSREPAQGSAPSTTKGRGTCIE